EGVTNAIGKAAVPVERTVIVLNPTPVSIDLALDGTGPLTASSSLLLSETALGATTRSEDSTAVGFAGGNPWQIVGTWAMVSPMAPGRLEALNDLHVWLGLKISDDQRTRFDVRAELVRNRSAGAAA